jgi:hypothetical protein
MCWYEFIYKNKLSEIRKNLRGEGETKRGYMKEKEVNKGKMKRKMKKGVIK